MSKHSPVHAVTARRVTNGSVSLAVFEQGKADGETIVLVHGWPDTHELWNRIVPLLADDFRVVSYDSRGAGESTIPSRVQDYQLSALAGDLFAVIDAVSPGKPVHVLAHDWGSVETWEAVCEPGAKRRSRRSRPSRAPISIISQVDPGERVQASFPRPGGAGNCVGLHRSVPDSRPVHPSVASVVLQALAGISGLLRRSGPPCGQHRAHHRRRHGERTQALSREHPAVARQAAGSVHGRACSAHSEQVRQSRSSGGIRRHRKMGLRPAATRNCCGTLVAVFTSGRSCRTCAGIYREPERASLGEAKFLAFHLPGIVKIRLRRSQGCHWPLLVGAYQ